MAGSTGGVSSPGMVSLNSAGTASPAGTPAPPAAPPSPTQQQQEQVRTGNPKYPALSRQGVKTVLFAAIVFAAIQRHTGWWPAPVAIASYLLPKQDGVTSNCSKRAICCNYLERILTLCPAYQCSLKYLDNFQGKSKCQCFCLKQTILP